MRKPIDAKGKVVTINGVDFTPIPGVKYLWNYTKIAEDVASGKINGFDYYRTLCQDDLWFLMFFGLKVEKANHPFVVEACYEVQNGPKSHTVDLWARGHFKTTTITFAETIQDILNDPDERIAILGYSKGVATTFLSSIKTAFEHSEFLKAHFPDILYQDPARS